MYSIYLSTNSCTPARIGFPSITSLLGYQEDMPGEKSASPHDYDFKGEIPTVRDSLVAGSPGYSFPQYEITGKQVDHTSPENSL
jgi:hypothetical protein